MNREEVLEHLRKQDLADISNKYLLSLESVFQQQKNFLSDEFERSFVQACEKLESVQKKKIFYNASYLVLTMLRTKIVSGDFRCVWKVCNQLWLLDPQQMDVGEYQCDFVWQYYLTMQEELNQARKRYVGKTITADTTVLMLEEAPKFMQYISKIAQNRIRKLTETDIFSSLRKNASFQIQVGEYLGEIENIYTENRDKNFNQIAQRFQQKNGDDLCYEDLRGTVLQNADLSESDLRFSDLRNSDFSGSSFRYSRLVGCIFEDCQLPQVDFRYCLINQANFVRSNLESANFARGVGYAGLENDQQWDCAGYLPINFSQANLKGVCFADANLNGAIFSNSIMENTIFSATQIQYLDLTEQQKNNIEVVG